MVGLVVVLEVQTLVGQAIHLSFLQVKVITEGVVSAALEMVVEVVVLAR